MSWKLIIPPTALAIALADGQRAARVDVDEGGKSPLDDEIRAAIETYTSEAETITKRAIMEQTWRLTLDRFDGAIKLAYAPLLAVEHVKYLDVDGVLRTLAPQDYQADAESEPGYIVPAPGCAWPETADRINALQVQIRCGYGADHTAVPAGIRGFVYARVAEQYQTGKHAENQHVTGQLSRFVVYG
ncbi:head-tail connector protein [Massilia sp. BKSP1R2A-1]|uniref:head-tail connector protein n=1 Tax=Massilia sp. BKSP1R2A-1 TaxID=3422595 RepID=UPI003D34D4CF